MEARPEEVGQVTLVQMSIDGHNWPELGQRRQEKETELTSRQNDNNGQDLHHTCFAGGPGAQRFTHVTL